MQGEIPPEALDLAERGEFGTVAKQESALERRDQVKRGLGPFRLGLLALHRYLLFHIVIVSFSLAANVTLQSTLPSQWARQSKDDMIMDIVWLILLIGAPFVVKIVIQPGQNLK